MSWITYVFVGGPDLTLDELAAFGEEVWGAAFKETAAGPLLLVMRDGKVAVFLSAHVFKDDPEDDDLPSFEAHPYWFEIQDLEKNYARQNEVAEELFLAVADAGRWRTFVSGDLQTLELVYSPEEGITDWR